MNTIKKIILGTNLFFISAVLILLPHAVFADIETGAEIETGTSTPVIIHLDVRSATSTLFKGDVSVSECSTSSATSSTPTLNAYCALQQSGLEIVWSDYGDDRFLTSINGVANDFSGNLNWNWFSNLEYGQTSMNQHILASEEKLLVTIGRMPLKLVVSTTTPSVGETATFSVFLFGFDEAWNSVWLPAASSSIKIGTEMVAVDAQGQYSILISTTMPFTVSAWQEGFIESEPVTIIPLKEKTSSTPVATSSEATTSTTTATTTETTPPPSNNSSGGNQSTYSKVFDPDLAVQFLLSKQKSDGSFGSHTDWVAIALASARENQGRDKLVSYLKDNPLSAKSNATDYERRAMALMALGINPYNGTSINYIQKIADLFDGTQVGDASFINDDVFALFPLIKAGYTANNSMIKKIVTLIISEQDSNGSWKGSIDMTAATIQALDLIRSLSGVDQAVERAREFLYAHQQSDGGFGSAFSTSWTLQAIASLDETSTSWIKGGKNPLDSLNFLQQSDGGVEPLSSSESTRVWSTAYAVPAALGKSWGDILKSFSKQELQPIKQEKEDEGADEERTADTNKSIEATSTESVAPTIVAQIKPPEYYISDYTEVSTQAEVAPQNSEEEIPTGNVVKQNEVNISNMDSLQVAAVGESGAEVPFMKVFVPVLILIAIGVGVFYKLRK